MTRTPVQPDPLSEVVEAAEAAQEAAVELALAILAGIRSAIEPPAQPTPGHSSSGGK